ncbi:MAG TPA: PhzF family phenazine biosynthesis protein [Solirubrobacterales bacterium]|nr:PhzF family phenazine biosynthesis protein [Solirubrobacterales bacterium]
MAQLHVLRVFVDERGEHGNPLGVFLDGDGIEAEERQRIAAELGFSETVFVEDAASGRLRIHTPEVELPFAGHPLVGTAWLLAREGVAVETLRPPAGEVGVHFEDELTWISARPEWCPAFELRQLSTPTEVEALEPPAAASNLYAWAWIDEAAGTIRARCFVPEVGIAEDEATGSAALSLASRLGRRLTIRQGRGSVLFACPPRERRAEVGGRVVFDESRSAR